MFWGVPRAQDLKRVTRDQNSIDILTIMQIAATCQHLALFSTLEFVNAHTVIYFDSLILW